MGVCIWNYHDVCPTPPGPTSDHEDCWTGIKDEADFGDADGIGCDVGCVPCRDLQGNVIQGATSLTRRYDWPTLLGAARFLFPSAASPGGTVGADNMLRVLKASQPLWVKAGAAFYLGCCHSNTEHECFGEWSTCSCFDEVSAVPNDEHICEDGSRQNHFLSGMFMDRFAWANIGWGPTGWVPGLFTNTFYCRKFTPHHECTQNVRVMPSGGISGALGRIAALVRTGFGEFHGGCTVDMFILLVGEAVANRDCLDGFASSGGQQNEYVGTPYIVQTDPCWAATSFIRCEPDPTDRPRFLTDSENFPLADVETAELHNSVLDIIWSREWPDVSLLGGSMNFDYLDHYPPNAGIGHFGRTYRPQSIGSYAQSIGETVPVVVKELPNSYAKWGDMRINASFVVAGIHIFLVYVPVKIYHHQVGESLELDGTFHSYPFAAVDIAVTYGIRLNSVEGTRLITRSWIPPPNLANPSEIPHTARISLVEGEPGTFPRVTPRDNRIVYVGEDGEIFEPPSHFVWRGLLSRLTKPSCDDQKNAYVATVGTDTEWAQRFLAASSDHFIGGQPALLETRPNEPNQIWGGRLYMTFRNTPGWVTCMG